MPDFRSVPYTLGDHLDFYAELGFNCIPLNPAIIGNSETGKRPQLVDGSWLDWAVYQKRMSTTVERNFWWPHKDRRLEKGQAGVHNVGIVTGSISNLIVLDIDDHDTYDRLLDAVPELADDFTVKSGRGYHIYLRPESSAPIGTVSFLYGGKRHHVKAEGGYVVAAPSLHYSGAAYALMCDGPTLDESKDSGDKAKLSLVAAPTLRTVDHGDIAAKLLEFGAELSDQPEARRNEPGWAEQIITDGVSQGERQETLIRIAGHLAHVHGEHGEGAAMAWLQLWNEYRVHPPLSQRELEKALRFSLRKESTRIPWKREE